MSYFRNIWAPIALIIFIFVSVIRPSVKYLGSIWPGLIFIAIGLVCVFGFSVFFEKLKNALTSRLAQGILLVSLGVTSFITYPIADNLKLSKQGWDQDDCVISGIQSLSNGMNPYILPTYFGNPCSTGAGVLISYSPFVLLGLYSLAGVFFILLSVLSASLFGEESKSIGAYLYLLLLSPLTLEMLANGSDLIFVGAGIVISSLLADLSIRKSSTWLVVISGIVVGLVSSSRINLFIVLIATVAYVFGRNKHLAIPFLASSLFMYFVPSFLIWLNSPEGFTPLHLIAKSQKLVPIWLLILAGVLTVAILIYRLSSGKLDKENLLETIFYALLPQIITLSFGGLVFAHKWDVYNWENANYLFVLIPSAAILLSRRLHLAGLKGSFKH